MRKKDEKEVDLGIEKEGREGRTWVWEWRTASAEEQENNSSLLGSNCYSELESKRFEMLVY